MIYSSELLIHISLEFWIFLAYSLITFYHQKKFW
jgi:hypothetical protein